MPSQICIQIMMSNSKGNTLYCGGVTIDHEGEKLNNEGEKASCANGTLHASGVGL